MKIDWTSKASDILLNPHFPQKTIIRAQTLLPLEGDFAKHLWLATSGSTAEAGHVKFVALAKEALLASAAAVNAHLRISGKDIWINPLPHFHVGGLAIYARAFLNGAKVAPFKAKWNPHAYCQTITEYQGTFSALVPTQIYDLVNAGLKAPKSLRGIIVGGGQLSVALYHHAYTLGWPLLPSYGLTEASSQVATATFAGETFPEMHLLPHLEVHTDEHGFVCLKGNALLTSYAFISPAGCQLLDPKVAGWFKTEDKGQVVQKAIRIFGRDTDFVKIGGESVDFKHLEEILDALRLKLGLNSDVTLIAMEDARLGHAVHLAVAGSPSEQFERLIAAFQQAVLPFERIRQVHYLACLPRSPLNKLLRGALRSEINKL